MLRNLDSYTAESLVVAGHKSGAVLEDGYKLETRIERDISPLQDGLEFRNELKSFRFG